VTCTVAINTTRKTGATVGLVAIVSQTGRATCLPAVVRFVCEYRPEGHRNQAGRIKVYRGRILRVGIWSWVVAVNRVHLRIAAPRRPIPPEDVVFAFAGVVFLAGETERLVARGAGAVGGDAAEGVVLGAPVDGAGGIGLEDGGCRGGR
jgi:hypothetical protein